MCKVLRLSQRVLDDCEVSQSSNTRLNASGSVAHRQKRTRLPSVQERTQSTRALMSRSVPFCSSVDKFSQHYSNEYRRENQINRSLRAVNRRVRTNPAIDLLFKQTAALKTQIPVDERMRERCEKSLIQVQCDDMYAVILKWVPLRRNAHSQTHAVKVTFERGQSAVDLSCR